MKRLVSLMLAAGMMVSVFAGCGSKTEPAKPDETKQAAAPAATEPKKEAKENKLAGKITLAIGNGQKVEDFQKDAKEFMDKNPGTQIEIEFVEKIETIKTRMAAGELPDIAQVPREVLPKMFADYYLPIDGLGFSKDNIYFYDAGTYEGHLYNVTSMVGFSGIVYNKKVFKDAGVEKVPLTLDDFYAACEKIKAKGIVPFASNFKDKWPLGAFMGGTSAIAATGDGNYNNKLVGTDLISGANLDTLNFLRSMKEKGYLEKDLMSTNWGGFVKDLGAGKIAMAYLGSWLPPQVTPKEDIGMFPFPGAKGVVMGDDWRFAIAKTSKAPELAKAYFKHLFQEGAYYRLMGVTSPLKGVKYSEPFIQELTGYGVAIVEQIPDGADLQAVKNKFAVDFNDIMQEYMLSKTPNDVVKKYNDKWAEARKAVGK